MFYSQYSPSKRMFLSVLLLLAIMSLLLLIGPRVPTQLQAKSYVVNIPIKGPFGVSLNYDSPEFIRDAISPALLLKPNSVRQSRPGIIWAAYLLSKPLAFLNKLNSYFHPRLMHDKRIAAREQSILRSGLSVFAAYALINILMLLLACVFYFSLVRLTSYISVASISLITILFCNDVTRQFLWSPHVQIFSIFAPVLLVWLLDRGLSQPTMQRYWYLISLGMGCLTLAYGIFILYSLCLFLIVVRCYMHQVSFLTNFDILKKFFYSLCMHGAFFVLPTLIWYLIVIHFTGHYYVHESEHYHQFVWIKEAWQRGTLFDDFLGHIKLTLQEIVGHIWFLCLTILAIYAYLRYKCVSLQRKTVVYSSCFVMLLFTLFVILDGSFKSVVFRLTYSMVPPLIVLLGYVTEHLISHLERYQIRMVNLVYLAVTCGYAVYALLAPFPAN